MGREIELTRGTRTSQGVKRAGEKVTVPNREADFLIRIGKARDAAIKQAYKEAAEAKGGEAEAADEGKTEAED